MDWIKILVAIHQLGIVPEGLDKCVRQRLEGKYSLEGPLFIIS